VVADNGSTDGSIEIAKGQGARVVSVSRRGYGAALRGGLEAARGRYLVMGDADGSYDFREAVPMVARLRDGLDLCMGSRMKGRILPGAMPWKNRWLGNPALTGFLNLVFRSGLSDAHCGLRAFTQGAFRRLKLQADGMEFASEMVVKAALLNLPRGEVPITLSPDRRNRKPHLRPWRDGWRHLRYIVMLSPTWLFLGPALGLGTLSALLAALLLSQPSSSMVRLGPLLFGDHWMPIASAGMIAAQQIALIGMAATLYGIRQGYRRPGTIARCLAATRLEHFILAGLALILLGALDLGLVVGEWTERDYGALNKIREVILAMTVVVLGLQTLFGGFLLSIVNGNDGDFDKIPH
jgi:glycosyl transferase family 2